MITITNAYMFPLVISLWVIDTYVLLIGIRLLTRQLASASTSTITRCLAELIDPIPTRLHRWLSRYLRKPVGEWVAWLGVILILLMARHLLLCTILARSRVG